MLLQKLARSSSGWLYAGAYRRMSAASVITSLPLPPVPLVLSMRMLRTCCSAAPTKEVWDALSLPDVPATTSSLDDLWRSRADSYTQATIILAVLWNIWKHRNTLIFNHTDEPVALTVRRCTEDVRLWARRYCSVVIKNSLATWCTTFDPP